MVRWFNSRWIVAGLLFLAALTARPVHADPPAVAYIFPAGGQRGTTVPVRVGGLNLYDKPFFTAEGAGLTVPSHLQRMPTVWFEGPLIKQPASQQKEDYPQDYAAEFAIAADAPLGSRSCRARTAQGISTPLPFVVGHLPEVVEVEQTGEPNAVAVALPVTINGRIFPREDVDLWSFPAEANRPLQLVLATSEFGSPLEGMLEVLDPAGRVVAECTSQLRRDPQLRFTPSVAGQYTVRIRDVRSNGLQNHIYRLTITAGPWLVSCFPLGGKAGTVVKLTTHGLGLDGHVLDVTLPADIGRQPQVFAMQGQQLNPVMFDVDQLDEVLETNNGGEVAVPGIANGRIAQAGEGDSWKFTASKGEALKLEVRAARLNSPLDAVLVIRDAAGKELARGDDLPNGSPDCELSFTPAADGPFTAEVRERFASRGGPAFAYRLKITKQQPGVEVTWDADALAVDVGKTQKLTLKLQRSGGFAGPVTLAVTGLPVGVSAEPLTIAANQNQGTLNFTCAADTPVSAGSLQITARGEHQGQTLEGAAYRTEVEGTPRQTALPIAVTLAAPFRYKGSYELKYISRGMELRKTYQIEREGFTGPLVMQLAERQGRHLQGVSGPRIVIPPAAEECDYPVLLSPEMELGRTSRVNVMLLGELTDAAGEKHQVGYSTNEQNEQLIALVSPSPLRLIVEPNPVLIQPGQPAKLHVLIKRDPSLREPVQLELLPAAHQRGIDPVRVEVPADRDEIDLTIPLAADAGPFNAPWILRGKTLRNQEVIVSQNWVRQLVREAVK